MWMKRCNLSMHMNIILLYRIQQQYRGCGRNEAIMATTDILSNDYARIEITFVVPFTKDIITSSILDT